MHNPGYSTVCVIIYLNWSHMLIIIIHNAFEQIDRGRKKFNRKTPFGLRTSARKCVNNAIRIGFVIQYGTYCVLVVSISLTRNVCVYMCEVTENTGKRNNSYQKRTLSVRNRFTVNNDVSCAMKVVPTSSMLFKIPTFPFQTFIVQITDTVAH